jgi:hypothetical protein
MKKNIKKIEAAPNIVINDPNMKIISKNESRNLMMVISGGKTMHIAIDPNKPVILRNRKQKPKKIDKPKEINNVEIPEDIDNKIAKKLETELIDDTHHKEIKFKKTNIESEKE